MATQEWQEGHDYAVAGHPHWNNPYTSEFDGGDRLKPYDWLAGWNVGYAELLIAPHPIPTAATAQE
jgi:hypothetical protein